MHVKAQLLDRVGNIRAGEGDVLESPDQATVGSQIVDAGGGACQKRPWPGASLTIVHANALKDIPSVLELVKEEVVWPLLYWDTEEVVKRVEVLHRKLLLKSYSGTLDKLRARGSEDDVVNIEQQVSSVSTVEVDEEQGVWLGLHEA
jgi:hypothetical protein